MRDTGSGMIRDTRANTYGEQLRQAAFEAVCRGWTVVPGRVGTDAEGLAEMRPLIENWDAAVREPDQAWTIWGQQPYGVLLVCGRGIDVLDVPLRVAELLPALADAGLVVPVRHGAGALAVGAVRGHRLGHTPGRPGDRVGVPARERCVGGVAAHHSGRVPTAAVAGATA